MAALGQISPESSAATLDEFHTMWRAAEYVTRGGVEYAQKLLVKTLGPDMARRVLDRVVKSFESTVAFANLEKADPQQLSKFILGEHPQTIALILAHLKPAQAAQLANSLPDDLRVDVLTRMASLDDISPEVITRISSVIEQRLKSLGTQASEQTAACAPSPSCSTASIAASAPRCSRPSRASRRIWRCRSAT